MPPKSRAMIDRDQSDMVNEGALHITAEQAAVFGVKREVMKAEEAEALRRDAAEAGQLRGQLADLMQQLEGRTSDLLVQDGALMVQGFQFSPTGLIAPDGFTTESWGQIGELLFRLEGSIQWLIGDWLVYGDGVHYGDLEAFSTQIEKDYGTLRNYAYVARSVNLSLRNDKLSYHHHVAVAKLPPDQQEYALAHAAETRISVARFRQWIRDQQGEVRALPAGEAKPSPQERSAFAVPPNNQKVLQFYRRSGGDPRRLTNQERSEIMDYIAQTEQHAADLKKWLG